MQKVTLAILKHYNSLSFDKWVDFLNKNRNTKQLERILKMSLTDYSDMTGDIEDAQEPTVLKAGTEVSARIIAVRSGISDKNDCVWYMPTFEVPGEPMVSEFNDFFWELDKAKLTDKEFARGLYKFQQFAKAFGIDYSRPFDWEDDLVGKEGWMIVGARKTEEWGEQNTVKKYIAPR